MIILLFSFCVTDVAAARGGCFAGGTAILTTEDYKPIEQLDQSDRIIGYNFTTHHPEEGNIGEIQVLSSPGYFLINDKIKVTESHPFYIKTSTGVKVVKAQKLKPGDQLVGEESHPVISSLDSNLAAHSSTPLKWSELPCLAVFFRRVSLSDCDLNCRWVIVTLAISLQLLVFSLRFLLLMSRFCGSRHYFEGDRSEFRIRDRCNYSWVGVINN